MVIKVLVFTPDVLTTTEGERLKTNREETGLYRLEKEREGSFTVAQGYSDVTWDITRDICPPKDSIPVQRPEGSFIEGG